MNTNDWRDQVAVLLAAHAASPNAVRHYSTFDFGRQQDAACLSLVAPTDEAEGIVLQVRKQLPPGLVTFVGTTQWLGDERHGGKREVVVGPGASQFDIVRLARTDGINYGIDTAMIVAKLQTYDQQHGIDIRHANSDSIEFSVDRVDDVHAFAQDLYAFCPDVVEQGTGSMDALAESIDVLGLVHLWWD